jgi:hypothetical protein
MDRLFFENIRCFTKRQDVPLAPLTLLVGENSSGKSTFLALVRLAWDLVRSWQPLDFNEEPFLLGAFPQIVGRGADRFMLGMELMGSLTVTGVFGSKEGIPQLELDSEFAGPGLQKPLREAENLLGPRPYAFAPVRSRPRRTYDPIGVHDNPEGSHIPMTLAGMSRKSSKQGKALLESLREFGRVSGLFEKIEVRHLGKSEGDPFQIQIHIGGSTVNLIDVGYGVSQALPIIVDCLRGEEHGTFLLQQPEVHLHPRAQAELGSFLGVLAKQQHKRFVIETHSDYLVDRIRMDIRDGKGLKPEDVSLLYFERTNGQASIHRLALDEHGNLLDPPAGYRRFFLDEERRFLGG